jgi:Holliday junction DNA helicase RuvA
MFAFLRGTVATKGVHQIALDVQGVGYHVLVPERIQRKLAVHQEVTLLTYCHIRENAFDIFGFLKEEERGLFTTLLSINGVGPKVALSVISAFSVSEFGRALQDSDVAAFTKVSGVGKKMAQRIVLEMKSKLGQDPELSAILGETPNAAEAVPEGDDVYEALLSLGCTPAEAKNAATKARKALGDDARDEDLVREALRSLAKAR